MGHLTLYFTADSSWKHLEYLPVPTSSAAMSLRLPCMSQPLHRISTPMTSMERSRDMYRSLYFLCGIAITALGFAQAARAEEASDAAVYVVAYIEVMPSSTGEAIALLRQ